MKPPEEPAGETPKLPAPAQSAPAPVQPTDVAPAAPTVAPAPVESTTARWVSPPPSGAAEQQMRRLSRRSFAVAGGAAAAGFGGWLWLRLQSQDAGIPWFLRKTLDFNGRLAQTYFNPSRLSPTYPSEQAREPRVNGQLGMANLFFDPLEWKLTIEMPGGKGLRQFSLDEIKSLPRAEMVTQLKCIEGWSVVVRWAGARLADFLSAHMLGLRDPNALPSRENLFEFVQFETPDQGYYVGLDMASAMHPQTLLCYELNGKSLSLEHGAPLRLVIPVKYGIKSIKRIGTIRFLDARPADYWAERGYDWYAGL